MNTVCVLPGCPHLVPEEQVRARAGYCDAHLLIGVMERLDEVDGRVENLTGFVERITRELELSADARDGGAE